MFTKNSALLSTSISKIITDSSVNIGSLFNPSFNQIIKSLFSNNEQGFAYDPNDLTTMFQDAAGTIPVTAAGQPVGLMLDKSKGLVLSSELLINNSFNTDTNWIKGAGWTISNGAAYFDGSIMFSALTQNIVLDGNALYKVEIDITGVTTSTPDMRLLFNNRLRVDTASKNGKLIAYIQSVNNEPITSFTIQSRGTAGDTAKRNISSVSLKKVSGNHAYQTTSSMRPILRQNAVTGAYYLAFDGSDDFLVTSSINFTATDKISLFAGVRKLSDVSIGSVFCFSETPISSQGVFEFYTPQLNGGEGGAYYSRGTATKSFVVAQGLKSPSSIVLSAKTDISSNSITLKLNSSIVPPTTSSLGGGYFGNHPLYIGRRGGTAIPFNGHIYSLIGVGRLTTDDEVAAIEKELVKRTGVTLSV